MTARAFQIITEGKINYIFVKKNIFLTATPVLPLSPSPSLIYDFEIFLPSASPTYKFLSKCLDASSYIYKVISSFHLHKASHFKNNSKIKTISTKFSLLRNYVSQTRKKNLILNSHVIDFLSWGLRFFSSIFSVFCYHATTDHRRHYKNKISGANFLYTFLFHYSYDRQWHICRTFPLF